ncbi:MAG: hypothetical protein R2882_12855 [Gemmatimonadales bacterium]
MLLEPDTAQIGRFANIATARSGDLFVSDLSGGRVLRFGRDGSLRMTIGRSGSGPGELRGPTQPALVNDDSVLVVMDPRSSALSLFDVRNGGFLRRVQTPFREPGHRWTFAGDTAVFGLTFSSATLARWPVPDDSVTTVGAVDPRLSQSGPVFLNYGKTEVVPHGEAYLAAVPTVPGLQVLNSAGRTIARVDLPPRGRRGIPPDLIERHMADQRDGKPFQYRASVVADLATLTDGYFAVIWVDLDLINNERPEPSNARFFVSLLSPDLGRACIDIPFRVASDTPLPFPGFSGDTIVAFARQILPNGRLRSVVYRYALNRDDCQWIETGGAKPVGVGPGTASLRSRPQRSWLAAASPSAKGP